MPRIRTELTQDRRSLSGAYLPMGRTEIVAPKPSWRERCDKGDHPILKQGKNSSKRRLSEDEYSEMIESQGFVCAICGTDTPGTSHGSPRFCIDHCHETDKVRGLLCRNCNLILGHAKDDQRLLQKCIDYLTKDF